MTMFKMDFPNNSRLSNSLEHADGRESKLRFHNSPHELPKNSSLFEDLSEVSDLFIDNQASQQKASPGTNCTPEPRRAIKNRRIEGDNETSVYLAKARQEAERERQIFKTQHSQGHGSISISTKGYGYEDAIDLAKHERRLKSNRRSAAASRIRRLAYIGSLEKHLVELEEKLKSLEKEVDVVRGENVFLKDFIHQNFYTVRPETYPELPPTFEGQDEYVSENLMKEQHDTQRFNRDSTLR